MDPIPREARVALAWGMQTSLASVRLAVGRFLGGGATLAHGMTYATVPVTVRARTSDGADLRLLVEVHVEVGPHRAEDADRFVHALTVPAMRQLVAQHDLLGLGTVLAPERSPAPELAVVRRIVREGVAEVGMTLVDVELVAAEHLLASPSTDPAHGSG